MMITVRILVMLVMIVNIHDSILVKKLNNPVPEALYVLLWGWFCHCKSHSDDGIMVQMLLMLVMMVNMVNIHDGISMLLRKQFVPGTQDILQWGWCRNCNQVTII